MQALLRVKNDCAFPSEENYSFSQNKLYEYEIVKE